MSTLHQGDFVVITLQTSCHHERPHSPAEDGMRGLITGEGQPGDHPYFVLFSGRARECRTPAAALDFLPLGRCYRADELEPIP